MRDTRDGELAITYNVLGSYTSGQLQKSGGYKTIEMRDIANVMLRTVLITDSTEHQGNAQNSSTFWHA
ncbi:MAG: hypothetical protein GKR98_02440 [Boseongicola sp.]|nr:MAG: hypothetical protein GKR98_02440 [Boseongicola sp.]